VVFTAGLLSITAAWLLIRRFGGALLEPLPSSALLVIGASLGALLAVAGLLERRILRSAAFGWISGLPVLRILLTSGVWMLGIAVSLPGNSTATLIVFWAFIVVGTAGAWSPVGLVSWIVRRTCRRNGIGRIDVSEPPPSGRAISGSDPERRLPAFSEADEEAEEEEETLLPEEVSQRIVRARDERGAEIVYGTVRCDFVAGQRQQSIHIAFCPPLRAIANLTTDQVAGPAVQIKPMLVETFGAGLEVKLGAPSKGLTQVQIQFFAFEKPADDVAE
jgi:hypothetical protein